MSPEQLDMLSNFTGTYERPIFESGVVYPNPTNYMHPALSLMIVLLVSAGATGLAVWGFNRKQL